MEITVVFTNYKEPTISTRRVAKSIVMSGVYSSMEMSSEEYIDFDNLSYSVNNIDYPILSVIDIPYKYVCKYSNYEIPSISKHTIAFSVNRDVPFVDSYNIKMDKPKTFMSSIESSFEVAGVYINDLVLERSFSSIPNDLKDYEESPSEEVDYDEYYNLKRDCEL